MLRSRWIEWNSMNKFAGKVKSISMLVKLNLPLDSASDERIKNSQMDGDPPCQMTFFFFRSQSVGLVRVRPSS